VPAAPVDAAVAASQVLKRLDSAWNAADGARFAAEFSEDADVINIFGAHFSGRADIAKRMQSIFETVFKGSTHRSRKLEMARYLSQDAIIALSSSGVAVSAGPLAPETRNRRTFILTKSGDAWRIRHWHNTTIRDQEQKAERRHAEPAAAPDPAGR
jgi:uncharacterized protein (TIGR02246 family)